MEICCQENNEKYNELKLKVFKPILFMYAQVSTQLSG